MKRCPGCNHEIADNAQRCDYCGIALGGAARAGVARQHTLPLPQAEGATGGGPLRQAAEPSSPEPPLVMVGRPVEPPVQRRSLRPGHPQLPMPTIGLDEAFRAGLDLVRHAFHILCGMWRIRTLTRNRSHACEGLGAAVWRVQLRHRDFSPIYDRLVEIERQEGEKRDAIRSIEQEALSPDADVRKAEKALQRVKIKKLNQVLAALAESKKPLFGELGAVAYGLRLPHEQVHADYAHIERVSQQISEAESLVANSRAAIRAIDTHKRRFTYLFWVGLTIMALVSLWAVILVLKSPK